MKKLYIYIIIITLLLNINVYADNTGSTRITGSKTITAVGEGGYSVTWNKLSSIGQYLGSGTTPLSTYGGDKAIRYTDMSGNIQYANPYTATTVKIKKGTSITFRMIAGREIRTYGSTAISGISIDGYDYNVTGYKGNLISCSYTPTKNSTIEVVDDFEVSENFNGTWDGRSQGWKLKIS